MGFQSRLDAEAQAYADNDKIHLFARDERRYLAPRDVLRDKKKRRFSDAALAVDKEMLRVSVFRLQQAMINKPQFLSPAAEHAGRHHLVWPEWIELVGHAVRSRLEPLVMANAAPRCGGWNTTTITQ